MLRTAPFALIWLIGLPLLLWLVMAPRTADPRYWQVDQVDIKLGSTSVFNPAEQTPADKKPTLSDAAKTAALPAPKAKDQNSMGGVLSPPHISADGIKINALNPDLQEDSAQGPIPKLTADGRAPWQYYARPFSTDDKRPRLAIIIKDIGLSQSALQDNLATLPGAISFAFSPYADDLAKSMQSVRDAGHETLLELPLELPPGSTNDNGILTLSSVQTSSVNEDNFLKLLTRMLGCVGVITDGGERLVNNDTMLRPLMQNLLAHGLLIVDDTQQNETLSPLIAEQIKAPWARTLFRVDAVLSQDEIDAAMGKAVAAAKQNGSAVVVASTSALTRSIVANWVRRLEHEGVALAPISAVATIGSAGQTTALPQGTTPVVQPPPGVMTPPPGETTPPTDAPEPATGPVNLLNPNNGAPATNLLDPSKPPAPTSTTPAAPN